MSLGRLSLSEKLAELIPLQLTWHQSPFTSTLTEHCGANPSTAGIAFGHTITTANTYHYWLLEHESYSG